MGVLGLGALLHTSVHASDMVFGTDELPIVWSSIITLSGGPAWADPGQNQYLYPNPTLVPLDIDYFNYNSKTGVLATGEIFFGLQHIIPPGFLIGELGLGIAGATDALATGVIDINGVPEVNTFSYKVDHARVELKGKLIGTWYKQVQPYISGSLGAGFNSSHAYVPTTINMALFPPDFFTASSSIAFSYTLGAGIQTMLTPHWQVGVGYEFADWGKSYLGPDPGSLLNGPGLTHMYTNEVLFSLSYLFNC